jgi:outer membrane receptor protein involved in Fe transport
VERPTREAYLARAAAWAAALCLATVAAGAAESRRGSVRDRDGAPVAGAEVAVRVGDRALPAMVTGDDGSFLFDPGDARQAEVTVRAAGFAAATRRWTAAAEPFVIVLDRARLREDVTVVAARGETRLGDTAARVVVLGLDDLEATAAPTLDDALRAVPGFSLFRRSDSRIANPTSQGASLRGIGPSGTSRALVMLDGVPLNDAFGGWVYWSRVPAASLERVEVMEGGASDLYGTAALGGVVQARERTDDRVVAGRAAVGTQGSADLSLFGAETIDRWRIRGAGEAFTTDGYVLVPEDVRGPVDTPAGSEHLTGTFAVERGLGTRSRVFARTAAFGESRTNGTPLTVNDTDEREVSTGADAEAGTGTLSVRGWYVHQKYHQTFSAVAANRGSEGLTRDQHVPSDAGGASLQWSQPLGARHALQLGVEGRWVEGHSNETGYVAGRPTAPTSTGGNDRILAAFASERATIGSRTLVTVGARLDDWSLGDRGATVVSPRASVIYHASPQISFSAAGYGAFRAPTLNELYRSFRVGNTLTQANPNLTPERLWGGEAGLAWTSADGRLRLRALGFLSQVEDPVANVTVTATAQLITRVRRNLGRTQSGGATVDGDWQLGAHFHASLGYAWTDSRVESFAANPALVGNLLPQVPLHQFTLGLRYTDPRVLDVSLQTRGSTQQFEDDQNLLPLAGYLTLDLLVSRRIRRLTAFAALENLTGNRYAVGLTPTPTEGPPCQLRVGLRFE